VVYYQYAQLLLQKLDDAPQALIQIDNALKIDPGDEALETLRALALNRIGRYKEAADIYEKQLANIAVRPRKWRITTRDQASECYRRWSEQDIRMKDQEFFKAHIDRACAILEEGIAHNDFDDRMGTLFASIIEDSLFFSIANEDEGYAASQLNKFLDVAQAVTLPAFRKFEADYLTKVFDESSTIAPLLKHPRLQKAFSESVSSVCSLEAVAEGFQMGHIARLPSKMAFGFIKSSGRDVFFHKLALLQVAQWETLKVEDAVRFELTNDQHGRLKAIRVVRL
jgi:cold shock CspA family protein